MQVDVLFQAVKVGGEWTQAAMKLEERIRSGWLENTRSVSFLWGFHNEMQSL